MTVSYRIIQHFLIAFLLLFLDVSSQSVQAQSIEAEALYKHGLALFKNGQYIAARLDFEEIITQHPSSNRVSSALVMLSKSHFMQGEYDLAESNARTVRRSHPESAYVDWVDYMLAACSFKKGDTEAAVEHLAVLLKSSEDAALKSHALNALKTSIKNSCDLAAFNSLMIRYDININETVTVEKKPATEPDVREIPVRNWQRQDTLRIGLIAPETGVYSYEGRELIRGVNAALEKYSTINGHPVELLIADSESNPVTAVLKARELVEKNVIAVIGPVYGASTVAVALEVDKSGIPFIAPTAPDIDLPHLGHSVFQINQTPILQAEALAKLARNKLGFNNAAVIASKDWWGQAIADTFTENFSKAGGEILTVERFDHLDYSDVILRIRNAAPEAYAAPDSFVVFNYGTAFPDTVIVKPDLKAMPQQMKPVNSIDCILVSAISDDAINIARLIRDYHIETVLLGDSGWSDENTAFSIGSNGEGSCLVATSTNAGESLGSSYFKDDYSVRISELQDITARKGYDACAMIIHCLMSGADTPSSMISKLESIDSFTGLSSRYTIDQKTHLNTAVDFVQIRNGRLQKFNLSGGNDDVGSGTKGN